MKRAMETQVEKILEDLKENPKIEILYVVKGPKAIQKIKQIEFPDDAKEATKWLSHWTTAEKKKACLVIYSLIKRVNKVIHHKFMIGDSVLGTRYSYEKGMEMINTIRN